MNSINPLIDYIERGAQARHDPSPRFSTVAYFAANPELESSGVNPLYHYHRHAGRDVPKPLRPEKPAGDAARPVPRVQAWHEMTEPAPAGTGDRGQREASPDVIAAAHERLATKPLTISVVVPSFNRAQSLCRALRSVLEQSYAPLEVIVVDDGSSDETEAVVRAEFARELDSGLLRYVRCDQRQGVSAARNAGLHNARGDLIAYLDSDNAWQRHFLLLMAATLAQRDDTSTAYCGLSLSKDGEPARQLFQGYKREELLVRNYIDLNSFVHRRRLFDQLGGFDENMTRLVDWELIIRYTRHYRPATVPYCLVDYYDGDDGDRVTRTNSYETNAAVIRSRVAHERVYSGMSPLRIGYVLWDFPALSQTFVLSEIRHLIELGYDVNVYFHTAPDRAATLDFEVPAFQVADAEELATLVATHERTLLHSHFAFPAVTRLTWPAAVAAGVPFTFMVHAVDIFHRANIDRNRIAEITQAELCLRVFSYGEFHRSFLIERGVPAQKIGLTRQAVRLTLGSDDAVKRRMERPRQVVACIARFVEKKGIDDLIRAAALLGDQVEVRLYGYGPLESAYRKLADRLDASSVRFAGVLEDAGAVSSALEEADIFALPCVVDSDGDMDGLPTVLGEAMAAGVPVITTDVSAIPETIEDGVTGFTVAPRDPPALARKIAEVAGMDADLLQGVVRNAQHLVSDVWRVENTVEALLDEWERPPLEVALVTYSRGESEGAATTLEIIRRIYDLTTAAFKLTIVDNASDPGFRLALRETLRGRDNASLILLDSNAHWGPAVNLAFRRARSDLLVYVCSKEGFVLRPGWQQEYLSYMRRHRDVALAGHLISSPAFPTGADYAKQAWFDGFRNKRFAELNPDREFAHVQGGLFALRRLVFTSCGEFSELVSQSAADIEYSYLLESLGWRLGKVANIPSITKKTRPELHAHLDENTVAAHPLSLESLQRASAVAGGESMFCNICAWSGDSFQGDGRVPDQCPRCGSTPFGRTVYRYLAGSALPFRNLDCVALLDDDALRSELDRMFAFAEIDSDSLDRGLGSRDLVIADLPLVPKERLSTTVESLAQAVNDGGVAIVSDPAATGRNGRGDIADELVGAGLETSRVSISSRAGRFAPGGLLVARHQSQRSRPL